MTTLADDVTGEHGGGYWLLGFILRQREQSGRNERFWCELGVPGLAVKKIRVVPKAAHLVSECGDLRVDY